MAAKTEVHDQFLFRVAWLMRRQSSDRIRQPSACRWPRRAGAAAARRAAVGRRAPTIDGRRRSGRRRAPPGRRAPAPRPARARAAARAGWCQRSRIASRRSLVAARLERAHEQQRALQIEDRVARAAPSCGSTRRACDVSSSSSGVATTSRTSLGPRPRPRDDPAVVVLAAHRQAAEQRRGGVVGMPFDLGREREPVLDRLAAR